MDDDLAPSKTEGFKVGEKKTIDEYKNLGKKIQGVRGGSVSIKRIGHLHYVQSIPELYVSYNAGHLYELTSSTNSNSSSLWVVSNHQPIDQEDEALNRWKASLGLGSGTPIADPNDPRKCVIKSLALEVEGMPDITIDLSAPGAVESLKEKPFTIKEGCRYQMKASFIVQHEVLSGLKYVQALKRKGIRVGKDQEMIGSYPPNTTDKPLYVKKFAPEEAPSGMLARGHYEAVSKFIDDDDNTHLKFEWSFDITKDWK